MLKIVMLSEKKISPICIGLKPDVRLQTQKPPRVKIQYRENRKLFWKIWIKGKNETNWLNASSKTKKGTTFQKRCILLKLCWMLDKSTQTLINHLNFDFWSPKQKKLLGQMKKINQQLILCTHMHMLH